MLMLAGDRMAVWDSQRSDKPFFSRMGGVRGW
jgi:hypothetical protein